MRKLVKPSPSFPLTAGKNGYWVKVVKGKQHRIGARWASPDEALVEWLRIKDQLLAGVDPKPDPNALKLRDAMNWFLSNRLERLTLGELSKLAYDDYVRDCKRVVETLGRTKVVATLTPTDFAKLRLAVNSPSPNTVKNRINRIRVAFNWLYHSGLIESPIRFGPSFVKPTAKAIRLHRAKQPKKLYVAADLRRLVDTATPELSAIILLGINCGFGNTDCATVPWDAIDGEWHNYHRSKTGIVRRAWLWPESLAALNCLPQARASELIFPDWTYYRISTEFRKLAKSEGVGLTFYALRHTFQTRAGDCKDPLAVSTVMGHLLPGMTGIYNEEVSDTRLKAACEIVRAWYLK